MMLKLCRSALIIVCMIYACANHRFYQQGLSDIDNGRWESAVQQLEFAHKEKPGDVSIEIALNRARAGFAAELADRGSLEFDRGDIIKAEECLNQALKIDRSNAKAQDCLKTLRLRREADDLYRNAVKSEAIGKYDIAIQMCRQALALDPNHEKALDFIKQCTARIEKTNTDSSILSQPISVAFENSDLTSVLRAIGTASNLNVLVEDSPELNRVISVQLTDIPLRNAIEYLAKTYSLLVVNLDEKSLLAMADTPENAARFKKDEVRLFRLRYASAADVKKMLDPVLAQSVVIADERLNAVVVRADSEKVKIAQSLIEAMDMRESEVLIQMELLEISRGKFSDLGVSLGTNPSVSVSVNGGLKQNIQGGNLNWQDLTSLSKSQIFLTIPSLYLNLLKQDSHTRILAEPRLRILNRQPAKFHVGEKVPVKVTTSKYRNTTEETSVFEYRDIGILLEMTPKILSSSELELQLKAEISSILSSANASTDLPTIGTREITTTLRLNHGQTEIIAGLIKDEERSGTIRIPLLGDIPVMGRLFSSIEQDKKQSDIVIAITPVLLDRGAEKAANDRLWIGPSDSKSTPTRPFQGSPAARPAPDSAGSPGVGSSAPPDVIPGPAQGNSMNTDEGEDPALVFFDPSAVQLSGESTVVKVWIENASNVASTPFYIEFNPAIVQVVKVEEGDFLSKDGQPTSFMSSVDNAKGRVIIGLVRLGAKEGVSGAGALVKIEMIAKGAGKSDLKFTNAFVKDPQAKNLPATFENGTAESTIN